MKAEQLQAFCLTAKYKNMTQAAEALGSSQPALSRLLAALQEVVGEKLYERTAYGVELTPAGEALLPYACAVTQTLNQAKLYVRDKGSRLRITLRLGISHSLVPSLTPRFLHHGKTLSEQFPSIKLQFTEGYSEPLIQQVLQRQLEAVFVVEPYSALPSSLISSRIGEDIIGLLIPAGHPLADQTLVSLLVIQGETLILPSAISAVHQRIQASLSRNRISPNRTIEVSGPTAVKAAVKMGLGLGVTLKSYYQSDNQDSLRFLQLEENGFITRLLRVTHELGTLEPAIRDALDQITL